MKTKGISIWERHVEHFVLLIAVLVFVAFTAKQFIGNPNAAKVGTETISPGDVDDMLKTEAKRLAAKLAVDSPAAVTVDQTPEEFSNFEAARLASISPGAGLPAIHAQYALDIGDEVPPGQMFVEPSIPAPTMVTYKQYFDALPEDVVDQVAELQARFTSAPHDTTWITPVAVFSVKDALAQFQNADAEAGRREIPVSWYKNRLNIIDVRIEREEMVDGKWGNPTLLAPIPGQFSYRQVIAGKVGAGTRDRILADLADPAQQKLITQPLFYPTNLDLWAPVNPLAEAAEDEMDEGASDEVRSLRKQLSSWTGKRDGLQSELEQRGCAKRRRRGDGDRGGAGGGAGGAGGAGGGRDGGGDPGRRAPGGDVGGPGGAGGWGGNKDKEDDRQKDDACKRIEKKLAQAETRIRRIKQDLEKLGGNAQEQDHAENPENEGLLVVWGHDMDIETGHTYRYRFTVDVYNPFFARKINLVEEQHHLAESIALSSAESEWSEPYRVEPSLRVFITRASPPGEGGPDGATQASVFRFFGGRWWHEDFRVEPGQRIGDQKDISKRGDPPHVIDFRTDWFVLDIVVNPTADSSRPDGQAAEVMLQNVRTGELTGYRDPHHELLSDELLELTDTVDLTESEAG